MARVRRDDSMSMSDIVFSDGESMNFGPDIYSPRSMNDVFSPNMSASSMGDLYSPRLSGRDQHSPAMSNYSTFSQEVKYIFDPNFGAKQQTVKDLSVNSTEDDYSQIQFSNKKSNLQRKSSTASQYSHRSQYSSYSNQKSVSQKVAPPPPPRTASSSSQLGEGTPRKHPVLSHSVSAVNGASYYYPYNQTRRKTWSPEGLQLGLNTTGMKREQRIRSYSNEQLIEQPLIENRDPIYEELDAGPPKLAPVSGMLNKSPGKGIIRPIAFKPVVANQKFLSPPQQYVDGHQRKYSGHDDGYGSQDYGIPNQNVVNTSHGSGSSGHMDYDRSASFSSDCNKPCDRPDSVPSSHLSRLSSNHMDSYVQTPSPSDSGVGELEAMLKEKDSEINVLREVMDKNERAIFQVYEDKKSSWIKEFRDLKEDYEKKLKLQQRKTYKAEQVLNLQVFKLQQEKKQMKEELDKLISEKEDLTQKCEAYAEETNRLQAQMDDATWQGRRPPSDISELQNQIDSLHNKLTAKSEEVLKLQSQLVNLNSELENKNKQIDRRFKENISGSMQRLNSSGSDLEPDIPLCRCEKQIQTEFIKGQTPERETLKPSLICEKDREVSALTEELDKVKLEFLVNKEEFEKEKEQWLEEKNKVIMYQKQLQLNYVQMFRKNKVLEAEVEQLTLELESRDMKLMALNGGEESVC